MKKYLLFAVLLILLTPLYAKDKYQKGFFIDKSNSKIECYIRSYGINKIKIKMENTNKAPTQIIRAEQVNGYVIGSKEYTSLINVKMKCSNQMGSKTYKGIFARPVINGKINLYTTQITCGNGTMYWTDNVLIIEKQPEYKAEQIRSAKRKIMNTLSVFMKDTPEVLKGVSNEKLSEHEIIKLVHDYNNVNSQT